MSDPVTWALQQARQVGPIAPPTAQAQPIPQHKHTGPLHSGVAGRTDHLPSQVPNGSYVLPADIVSGIGEGNSLAGFRAVNNMFASANRQYGGQPYNGIGPYGHATDQMTYGMASGGAAPDGVPVVAAGGEHVLSPQEVAFAGMGDMEAGHKALDAFVLAQRAKTVKTLQKLPGPRKGDE